MVPFSAFGSVPVKLELQAGCNKLIANMIVRISVLENLLISKGLVTREDLDKMNFDSTIVLAKSILDSSGVSLSDDEINSILEDSYKKGD